MAVLADISSWLLSKFRTSSRTRESSDGSLTTSATTTRGGLRGFRAEQGFSGAKLNRITDGWETTSMGPNSVFRMDGRKLRERARDLIKNNPLAKSAVEAFVANVVETGITPTPLLKDGLSTVWRRIFDRWAGVTALGGRECDVTGDSTYYELQALILTEVIVAGGCLIRFAELPRRGRTLSLGIELYREEQFDDSITEHNGNQVVNGIELERGTGRTLAYHLFVNDPDDVLGQLDQRQVRLPAEQCEYLWIKGEVGQKRGFTLLAAVIIWLWALGYYTDNELTASDIKSAWAYMILTDPTYADAFDIDQILDSSPATGTTDIYGNTIDRHVRGMVFRGAPGDKVQAVGPNVPTAECLPWIQLIQRSIAVGMGITYEELTGDYSQSNFANARCSRQVSRRRFARPIRLIIDHFCNPCWRRFVMSATRAGLEGFPSPEELLSDAETWLAVEHKPAAWESVSPKEDAAAEQLRLGDGTTTQREIVEARVDMPYEAWLERRLDDEALEMQLRQQKGLPEKASSANGVRQAPGNTDSSMPSKTGEAA